MVSRLAGCNGGRKRLADAKVSALVPLAYVGDMAASIGFYGKLGFAVVNRVPDGGEDLPDWALLRSDRAELMLARATAPVVAAEQAVLFYTYAADVAAVHRACLAAGIEPGPIATPFYNPGGEFRLEDPDGYVVYVAQI